MPSKYEASSDETVPIARSIIARELVHKYKLKETEVARYLDVAQAAISKYVRGKHSKKLKEKMNRIEKSMDVNRELINSYIKKISEGRKEYVNVCICTLCKTMNDFSCRFSHAYA